ncbi:interactor of constitutive active ROPs 1-like [Phragmites australis]|uniref:interactor of constitutive active ROPs 1-like n=1 Tax=Phragmites australis TaxID=29695 RepID=UPI002D784264|nr:interactor of constitutive active ROPs 1-like [Phragmites australis]
MTNNANTSVYIRLTRWRFFFCVALNLQRKLAGAGAGVGAGSRVAELEVKLEKAHGQLTEMREQLAAAEKARKDARAALVEAKKRFAAKKRDDVATSAPVEHDNGKVPVPADEAAVVAEGANEDKGSMSSSATDVLDAVVPNESGNNEGLVDEEAKKTCDDGEVSNAVENGDGMKGSPEVDELRAKNMEVHALRAKLMVIDTEVDELKGTLTAKITELDELRAKLASNDTEINKLMANLMAKDVEIAALEADNADLSKMAEEAADAVNATAARARETEHALRESAAREARLAERLRASERAREAIEAEAQCSRVQSEQWRKAAEEAAMVLGGGAPGAAGTSSDKRRQSSVGASERTAAEGADDESTSGKPKAVGAMRVLSNLWKKKARK